MLLWNSNQFYWFLTTQSKKQRRKMLAWLCLGLYLEHIARLISEEIGKEPQKHTELRCSMITSWKWILHVNLWWIGFFFFRFYFSFSEKPEIKQKIHNMNRILWNLLTYFRTKISSRLSRFQKNNQKCFFFHCAFRRNHLLAVSDRLYKICQLEIVFRKIGFVRTLQQAKLLS